MQSIKSRMMLSSLLLLLGFMVLTVIGLERAVNKRMLRAEEDKLQAQMYGILAAIDRTADGMSITVSDARVFESALFDADSGLRALLYDDQGEIWRSLSSVGSFPLPVNLAAEELRFDQLPMNGQRWFQLAFSIQWPNIEDQLIPYQLVLWKNAEGYFKQIERFRQTLLLWSLVTILLLMILMWLVMLWGLRPLSQIGEEVRAIENGEKDRFDPAYPKEINPLTQNLNRLLQRDRHQMQRYRNALDDLAHSLKTPLAVLRGLTEKEYWLAEDKQTLQQQSERMDQIVSYQLQKAATLGGKAISKPVDFSRLLDKTIQALTKVYRDKAVRIESVAPDSIFIRTDESDVLELLGNLIDNACKYGEKQVRIHATKDQDSLQLIIEDDGKGIDIQQMDHLLGRGFRLDQTREGQGIGLAVVRDIIIAYEIDMQFARSSLGGLQVTLRFNLV